eukprot:CAMPEP_0206543200 /NCGR_PEP_ID=MMETSP0325_2-20121206/10692_1 /ASSEMBLY_ACC=CAM_ASM_000347 /TAXON_ID=2866 /ORGANISM="Crypthecodinium cohnii, Strain Seligo" /LENGTH=168 /DNA_ID=CAMNT_0054041535 /DNA_START=53 /DNA_END=559 /DNA_ORIENTATION=+
MADNKPRNNWDFNFETAKGEAGLADPPGFKVTSDEGAANKGKGGKATNTELLERKAWEVSITPIQSVGMNLFMLWMSGSSPSIFPVMIVGWSFTSIISQFSRVNTAFQNFKSIDTTLQKLAYLALCSVSLAYLLYHASGMGLLPAASGDWIAFIPEMTLAESSAGFTK